MVAESERTRAPLAGRVALVAGGSTGLGRESALRLACAGADVAVLARREARGLRVVKEIEATGRRALFAQADLTDWASAAAAVRAAHDELGGLDILIVNGGDAGDATAARFVDVEPQTIPDYFAGQLFGRLYVLSAALPIMCERRYGKVVVVTSDAGRVPTTGESLWGAAAAGLMFSVRAIGREVASFGVRVNAVSTTITRGTASWERYAGGRSEDTLRELFRKIEERSPLGVNDVNDVADAIYFFAGPGSDQITGATLSVNGGVSFPA